MENQVGEGRRQLRSACKTAKRSELMVIQKSEDVVLERRQFRTDLERKGDPKFKPTYNVDMFVSLFGELPDDMKTSFRNGPFRHLLDIPSLVLSNRLIKHFIHTMDCDFKSFSLGGRKVYFGPEDFAICMGLSLKGRPVVWSDDSNRPCPSVLRTMYQQIDKKTPTLEGLKLLVKHEIQACNMEGSLRAFYAYTLGCLIFSRRRTVETSHWPLLDNLEDISNYAWGVAAYEYLRKSLQNIPTNDDSERRLDGCTYMLKILVLERGYASMIVGEDARKLTRIGRWTVGRLSKCKAEEILNCEPEKVIERLKVEDWEVDFAADMGVKIDNVVQEKKDLLATGAPPPAIIHNEDSIVTVLKRKVDVLESEVDCAKRKVEVLESKIEWAGKMYGVDWSLYPENVDPSKDSNEMSVEVVTAEYDEIPHDYVMLDMDESPEHLTEIAAFLHVQNDGGSKSRGFARK